MPASQPSSLSSIVLVRRDFSKNSTTAGLLAIAVLGILVLVTLAFLLLVRPDDADLPARLWRKLAENPEAILKALGGLLVIVAHLFIFYVLTNDRIAISAVGISYETPLPRWFPTALTGWNFPWTRIKTADVGLLLGMAQPYLRLGDGLRQKRKIMIDTWVRPEDRPKAPSLRELFRLQQARRREMLGDMRARLEQSPLILVLRAHNISIGYPEEAGAGLMFDLQSHPRTKAAVAVSLLLIFYTALDTFLIDETYVENFQWTTWGVAGLIAALLAQRWIVGPKIPKVVSIGLAAMVGLSVGVALYPGLLRLNQLTDSSGLQPHEYILRDYAELEPVEDGLPTVRFNHYSEYWRQFPRDSSHRLYLRRGGLGFYQLDQAPLVDAMRAYYEKQSAATPTPKRR